MSLEEAFSYHIDWASTKCSDFPHGGAEFLLTKYDMWFYPLSQHHCLVAQFLTSLLPYCLPGLCISAGLKGLCPSVSGWGGISSGWDTVSPTCPEPCKLSSTPSCFLNLRPLLAFRGCHSWTATFHHPVPERVAKAP